MGQWRRRISYPFRVIEFVVFYFFEVVISNFTVASMVWNPKCPVKPAVVAVNVEGMDDRQRFVLASLITMTPGTLSLDISACKTRLYIHAINVPDPVAYARKLEESYKQRVHHVF